MTRRLASWLVCAVFLFGACRATDPVGALRVPDDAAAAGGQEGAVRLTREALKIHGSAILVDGHNDLPWKLREDGEGSFDKLDIAHPQPDLHTDIARLRYINDVLPNHVVTEVSHSYNIRKHVESHDLIIGAVLIPGAKAPNLITRAMLKTMRPGTVIVDVAVDQGGCIETTRPTTHQKPTYIIDNIVHKILAILWL